MGSASHSRMSLVYSTKNLKEIKEGSASGTEAKAESMLPAFHASVVIVSEVRNGEYGVRDCRPEASTARKNVARLKLGSGWLGNIQYEVVRSSRNSALVSTRRREAS